jgi:exodeoxyribonuclease-3
MFSAPGSEGTSRTIGGEQYRVFNQYHCYWNPAERIGYSRVATFTRSPWRCSDRRTAFDKEGRLICTRYPGFLLFNVYFPSGQRGRERVDFKLDFYSHLLDWVNRLHAAGEKLVLCGDFNTAHREIDLRNPKQNRMTSGFLPEERAWIDNYLSHGLVDVFRALYPERIQYTWWTYRLGARQRNIGWRLDYFLVSEGLLPYVEDVIVNDDIDGSDHCPVSFLNPN